MARSSSIPMAFWGMMILLITLAHAMPIPADGNQYGDLDHQGWDHHVPQALAQHATEDQLRFQPALDFDKDGCYNAPAIDAQGNVNHGMHHDGTSANDRCRNPSYLDNNNVYVRSKCNNNWCAHMYAYYFEKDVAVENFIIDIGGSRHDWENVIVFHEMNSTDVKHVAISEEYGYSVRVGDYVKYDSGTHPKVVYHKNGGSRHSFRWSDKGDEKDGPENDKHVWYRGPLVDYDNGFPSTAIRDTLMRHDFIEDKNVIPLRPWTFEAYLRDAIVRVKGNGVGDFHEFHKDFNREFFLPSEMDKEMCKIWKPPLLFPPETYERPCKNNDPGFWDWIASFFDGSHPRWPL